MIMYFEQLTPPVSHNKTQPVPSPDKGGGLQFQVYDEN